jgi:hypothetical protein
VPIALSSPLSKSLRAFSPLESISQISRGPILPLLVPKAINDPSGENDQAHAEPRRMSAVPSPAEKFQMVKSWSVRTAQSVTAGRALIRNRDPSGDQAPGQLLSEGLVNRSCSASFRPSAASCYWKASCSCNGRFGLPRLQSRTSGGNVRHVSNVCTSWLSFNSRNE